MVTVLGGLAALGVFLSVGGGWTRSRGASRSGGAEAANTSVSPGPRFDPQSVSFVSRSIGWAWGPGIRWLAHGSGPGVLARTDDGGRHWRVIPTPGIAYAPPSAYPARWASGVRFVDRQHGYLFGGALYATSDGGRHWTELRPPNRILDLEVGAGRVFAVMAGCGGLAACTEDDLYRLVDGGRKFIRTGPPSPVDPSTGQLVVRGPNVFLLAPPPAYEVSTPLPLWVSANGGQSWQRRLAPCRGAIAPDALAAWSASGLALACGGEPGAGFQAKAFYLSTDGGSHWRRTGPGRLHGMSGGYIASLAAVDQRTWVLGEGRGTILITHNAGHTWSDAAFSGRLGPVEGWGYVSFIDARHAVAVPWTLNGSVLAFTNNAGRAWSETAFPTPRSR